MNLEKISSRGEAKHRLGPAIRTGPAAVKPASQEAVFDALLRLKRGLARDLERDLKRNPDRSRPTVCTLPPSIVAGLSAMASRNPIQISDNMNSYVKLFYTRCKNLMKEYRRRMDSEDGISPELVKANLLSPQAQEEIGNSKHIPRRDYNNGRYSRDIEYCKHGVKVTILRDRRGSGRQVETVEVNLSIKGSKITSTITAKRILDDGTIIDSEYVRGGGERILEIFSSPAIPCTTYREVNGKTSLKIDGSKVAFTSDGTLGNMTRRTDRRSNAYLPSTEGQIIQTPLKWRWPTW